MRQRYNLTKREKIIVENGKLGDVVFRICCFRQDLISLSRLKRRSRTSSDNR